MLAREILIHKRSLTPHGIKVEGVAKFAHLRFDKKGRPAYDVAQVEKKASGAESLGPCPVCAGDVVVGTKAFGCSNWKNGCKFVVWKTMAKKEIPVDVVQTLLAEQITEVLLGFTSKAGKSFNAKLRVVGGEVKFDFSG